MAGNAKLFRQRPRQTLIQKHPEFRQLLGVDASEQFARVDLQFAKNFSTPRGRDDCEQTLEKSDQLPVLRSPLGCRSPEVFPISRQKPGEDPDMPGILATSLWNFGDIGDFRLEQGNRTRHLHAHRGFADGEGVGRLAQLFVRRRTRRGIRR
jgi:hypothetical protein